MVRYLEVGEVAMTLPLMEAVVMTMAIMDLVGIVVSCPKTLAFPPQGIMIYCQYYWQA